MPNSNLLAVIGGSQAYSLVAQGLFKGKRLGRIRTPFGHSEPILKCASDEVTFLFLSRHGDKKYSVTAPFVNYRANLFALNKLGASRILAWSGPGAIAPDYKPGDFAVVDDIIDETKSRPQTFFEYTGIGFVRQNPVFCPTLRKAALATLSKLGLRHHKTGTYICTEGPRLETPAEIRKFASFRAHLIGMTLAPEVFLAKELEMCYAAICYVSNFAEGIRRRATRPGILFEGLTSTAESRAVNSSIEKFPAIIKDIARKLEKDSSPCICQSYLSRYRERGDVKGNILDWLQKRRRDKA